ncbi:unnamed protein product [Phaedon cochleariae]|uniref:Bro-N domain-containing protein n=1 Tax=Phaedon cochleariae TaxID=80249 RepID=A0A9N9SEJ3_PHACE|nr:unnamed protein product [Phaedon cochleariae]
MPLVRRQFFIDNAVVAAFECYIFITEKNNDRSSSTGEFWFKGSDIARYLGYRRPTKAVSDNVSSEWKRAWKDCVKGIQKLDTPVATPSNWQPHTILISEPGLYALITRSKKPEAIKFTKWIYEDVLPALRKSGQFNATAAAVIKENQKMQNQLILTHQMLIDFNRHLMETTTEYVESARHDAIALSRRLTDIVQDVIAKPQESSLLHTIALHELEHGCGEVVFTRCQRRSLTNTLKHLHKRHPYAKEVYRTNYVPNGVNVLNCVKEALRTSKIPYKAHNNNTLKLLNGANTGDLVAHVRNIIDCNGRK